jgi:hypothetical protein
MKATLPSALPPPQLARLFRRRTDIPRDHIPPSGSCAGAYEPNGCEGGTGIRCYARDFLGPKDAIVVVDGCLFADGECGGVDSVLGAAEPRHGCSGGLRVVCQMTDHRLELGEATYTSLGSGYVKKGLAWIGWAEVVGPRLIPEVEDMEVNPQEGSPLLSLDLRMFHMGDFPDKDPNPWHGRGIRESLGRWLLAVCPYHWFSAMSKVPPSLWLHGNEGLRSISTAHVGELKTPR